MAGEWWIRRGGNGNGDNNVKICRRFSFPTETPPLAAYDCEIPAFAGMVFRGNGELWAYFGGGIVGEFGELWDTTL